MKEICFAPIFIWPMSSCLTIWHWHLSANTTPSVRFLSMGYQSKTIQRGKKKINHETIMRNKSHFVFLPCIFQRKGRLQWQRGAETFGDVSDICSVTSASLEALKIHPLQQKAANISALIFVAVLLDQWQTQQQLQYNLSNTDKQHISGWEKKKNIYIFPKC